jgi:uncharacterized membrane protein YkvA (DUF1232 family)
MLSRLLRFLRIAGHDAVVLWYACRNPATPALVKLGAVLLAVYLISPVDLITDTLPILGWLDDVTLLAFGIPVLLRLTPEPALHQAFITAERLLSKWSFWRNKS